MCKCVFVETRRKEIVVEKKNETLMSRTIRVIKVINLSIFFSSLSLSFFLSRDLSLISSP